MDEYSSKAHNVILHGEIGGGTLGQTRSRDIGIEYRVRERTGRSFMVSC